MADKRITDLPELKVLYDDSLLVTEHDRKAYKIAGGLLRQFAAVEIVDRLPTPSENQRGKFLLAPNGDTDALYICMRINGIFAWAEVEPKVNGQITTLYLVDANGAKLKTADGMYLSTNV